MGNFTKRSGIYLLAVLLAVCTLFSFALICGAAEDETIYYYVNSETGVDANSGRSADAAVKTFTRACNLARRTGGTIVVTNEYHFPKTVTELVHDEPFTITTKDDTTDYGAQGAKLVFASTLRYVLSGDTTFKNITIDCTYSLVVIANFNAITFGEGVTIHTAANEAGSSKGVYVIGGYQSPADTADTTLDAHITIRSGEFYVVAGGSRQKGSGQKGVAYDNTTYIDIAGGKIDTLLGGPLSSQIGKNTVITVSGGEINKLCTGGDVTRRLEGNAEVTLTGGTIQNLDINNVVGAATVTIAGAKIVSGGVRYENDTIATMAKKANLKKTLVYDGHYYTPDEIAVLGASFDVVENKTSVYASANGTGDGMSERTAASFADAFAVAAKTGGNIVICDSITLDNFTEPAHSAAVTLKSSGNAKLTITGTYTLAGETAFDAVRVEAGGAVLNAANGKLIVTAAADIGGKPDVVGAADLYAGAFGKVTATGDLTLLVAGASVDTVTGGSSIARIEIASGRIGTVKTTDTKLDGFVLTMTDGEIGKVILNNVAKRLELVLYGGKIGAFEVAGENVRGSLTLDETKVDAGILGSAASLFTIGGEKVCYLKDGGTGSGSSAATACGSITEAYESLKNGGILVISGEYTLDTALSGLYHTKKITVTSVYDGVDYRKNGAKLVLKANYYCGGETLFENLRIETQKAYVGFYCMLNTVVFGDGLECATGGAVATVASIMGGTNTGVMPTDAEKAHGADLTIKSGTWQRVRGGSSGTGYSEFDTKLKIEGGTFKEKLVLASAGDHKGRIDAVIDGGEFLAGVYAFDITAEGQAVSGDVALTLNGGKYNTAIAVATNPTLGSYAGSYNVRVTDGNFSHLTAFTGTAVLANSTMTSALSTGSHVDLNAEVTGTMSFRNPIRSNGADPWLFFHDGFYYYIATAGTRLAIYKAANIGDLATTPGTVIYTPEAGKEWSKNLWSPEIHYFSAADVGEADAGWYCFLGSDSGDGKETGGGYGGPRPYVIKSLDGDTLLGRWGNPLTGEPNVPQKIEFPDSDFNVNELCGGCSVININNQKYIMFISEVGRETSGTENVNFYQTINIAKFDKPWRISGEPQVICRPDYDWEKVGSEDKVHPQVVEGSTAVYGKDGSIFIIYSGSGYWTKSYQLGQLKYIGGDPLLMSSWEKSPTSIFAQSAQLSGCGHASYVTDTDGQGWICYHAYKSNNTAAGRFAFVEPYTATKDGVVIGKGTKQPADINTTYTVNLNPLPLGKKISGFGTVGGDKVGFAYKRIYDDRFTDVTANAWFYAYVRDAYRVALANGTSAAKFSPDGSFTVAQAITAAANIHTAYTGKTVVTAGAKNWYDPYVSYCVANGIIKADQFKDYNAPITRGDMAIVFANILPDSEYAAVRSGSNPDVTSDLACYAAVQKLYNAGIVGGDAGTGKYRPNDGIKRSEACVIFTRIAIAEMRAK